MYRIGEEPFLECSSKGDKRFSAFYARIKKRNNLTIEAIYQSSKIFQDGSTGLSISEAKGKKAVNQEEVAILYGHLWDEYFIENKDLIDVILQYKGFSDIFGQEGHCCQAKEIYRIFTKFHLINSL